MARSIGRTFKIHTDVLADWDHWVADRQREQSRLQIVDLASAALIALMDKTPAELVTLIQRARSYEYEKRSEGIVAGTPEQAEEAARTALIEHRSSGQGKKDTPRKRRGA